MSIYECLIKELQLLYSLKKAERSHRLVEITAPTPRRAISTANPESGVQEQFGEGKNEDINMRRYVSSHD
jgi:hypothetical protein